jgi:bisphosphoglycerate-dependent phosphoglycerate mutase
MARKSLELESPYRESLQGILSFSTFVEAEQTIRRLHNLCENYRKASDKKGVDYCRQIALLGRHRAELIGRNKRVCLEKRLQKQEMANWFRVWLENPTLFDDWLALRKCTEEFRQLSRSESSK